LSTRAELWSAAKKASPFFVAFITSSAATQLDIQIGNTNAGILSRVHSEASDMDTQVAKALAISSQEQKNKIMEAFEKKEVNHEKFSNKYK